MFIEEYLQDLRRDRFTPRALLLYARRAAGHVREHWVANPGAVRSVWSVALVFFVTAFLAAGGMALAYDRRLAVEFFLQTSLWITGAFGLLTLHLGLLRDRDGHRLSGINLPISLTLLRLVLLPGITLFVLDRRFVLALGTYLLAALTDVADGWLARRWNQITRIGTVLDPLVDIVFNLVLFGGLAFAGLLPRWVFGIAALRYSVLLVGGACLYIFVGPVRIQPTLFGRLSGVITSAMVALLVLLHALPGRISVELGPLTRMALGVMVSATMIQVIALGWYNLRVMTGGVQARGQVVGDVRWGAR